MKVFFLSFVIIVSLNTIICRAFELSKLVKPSSSSNNGLVVRSGEDVVAMVSSVWNDVVAGHQDGLIDAKLQNHLVAKDLTPQEALYHYRASKDGIVDSARFFVTFGIASALSESSLTSPLLKAIADNDVDVVRSLLEAGTIDANDIGEDASFESTPLHFAASLENRSSIVDLLTEHGANVEARARHGGTPLMIAASLNNVPVIRSLVAKGRAKVETAHSFAKTTALHFAAEMGHVDAIVELCKHLQIDVNQLRTTSGGTPLHTAADSNRPLVIEPLIAQCGADPDALLNGDTTPMYLAAQRGFVDVIYSLAKMNANFNYVMPRETAHPKHNRLHLATVDAGTGIPYDYLNKNTEIGNGATALHAACENGHPKAVDALLRLGARQLDSMEGTTPLVISLQYRHPEIALRLLTEPTTEPFVNARTKRDGAFALFVAAGAGYEQVVDVLLARMDVKADLTNYSNATALSHAIYRGQAKIVHKLLTVYQKQSIPLDLSSVQAAITSPAITEADAKSFLNQASPSLHEDLLAFVVGLASHLSVKQENLLKFLLQQRGETRHARSNNNEMSLLHIAAQIGNVQAVKLLLLHGANASERGNGKLNGATPLYLASYEGHTAVVSTLMRHEANVSAGVFMDEAKTLEIPPLFVACEKGFFDVVDALVSTTQGAALVRQRYVLNRKDGSMGFLPVEMAAMGGHAAVVERLVAADTAVAALKAAVDHSERVYPVVRAISSFILHEDTMLEVRTNLISKLLLRQRETSTARAHDDALASLSMLCSQWDRVRLVFSPLHAAIIAYSDDEDGDRADAQSAQFVKLLLDTMTEPSVLLQKTSKSEMTPLALAIEAERMRVVRLLFKATTSSSTLAILLSTKTANGETPAQAARRLRNAELIKLIGSAEHDNSHQVDQNGRDQL